MNPNIIIPDWSFDVKYNYNVNPENPETDLLKTGSNCQVFAYELLRLNGKNVPNLWSDQMWNDREFSYPVDKYPFEPLDLLFFNRTSNLHGAHVGIYIGNNEVIHNSRKVGNVSIWKLEDFKSIDKYKVLIGGKRFF